MLVNVYTVAYDKLSPNANYWRQIVTTAAAKKETCLTFEVTYCTFILHLLIANNQSITHILSVLLRS